MKLYDRHTLIYVLSEINTKEPITLDRENYFIFCSDVIFNGKLIEDNALEKWYSYIRQLGRKAFEVETVQSYEKFSRSPDFFDKHKNPRELKSFSVHITLTLEPDSNQKEPATLCIQLKLENIPHNMLKGSNFFSKPVKDKLNASIDTYQNNIEEKKLKCN